MNMIKPLFIILIFMISLASLQGQQMNNESLEKILYVLSDTLSGANGQWEFLIEGLPMLCLTDEVHNRMRIISPVAEMSEVSDAQVRAAMEANFHSALDVKYAISSDVMWVAYIHPLKELTKDQAIDAISQVYHARLTFGTTYSSTDLVFPKQGEAEEEAKKKKKGKSKRS